jgi:hypothetical protein
MMTFDQVAFSRADAQISYFRLCSGTQRWYVAVFHSRILQIYDQITGLQEYEINVPSCKAVNFLDQEKLVLLEDGN